jgi:DNA-binding MarR family transcriptional regulator
MPDMDEKWELARTINAAQHLLHRDHLRRVFEGVNPESIPALTPPQCHMVMTIRERGNMTIKQLTQALCVKAPAASTMVERLVEMGLLIREENPADRREVLVRISPEEESLITEIEQWHLQLTLDLFEKIGPECAQMWGVVCKRIHEVLAVEQA